MMLKVEQAYPSDLTDQQWDHIKGLIPCARFGGRPRRTDVRQVVNAVFYLNRTGCAWRYLPPPFPPWQTVYAYYTQWKDSGVFHKIHEQLVKSIRRLEKRSERPGLLIVDSQSAKAQWGESRGFDGFKKVRGRKRSIFVDSLGLIHSVRVDSAQLKDHTSAIKMLDPSSPYFPSLAKTPLAMFLADGGYKPHDFQNQVQKAFHIWPTFAQSAHYKDMNKSKVLTKSNLKPKRWIVERTFAWFNNYRRLSRDYEKKSSNSEGMILVAMTQLMLRRLCRESEPYSRWH
jgi:putative transposase